MSSKYLVLTGLGTGSCNSNPKYKFARHSGPPKSLGLTFDATDLVCEILSVPSLCSLNYEHQVLSVDRVGHRVAVSSEAYPLNTYSLRANRIRYERF